MKGQFRLLCAHFFGNVQQGVHLLGDREVFDATGREQGGTIVGTGTAYPVQWPTLEMEALDDDARDWLEQERERLMADSGQMSPVEHIPMQGSAPDNFEQDYIPGLNIRRREPKSHGAKAHAS